MSRLFPPVCSKIFRLSSRKSIEWTPRKSQLILKTLSIKNPYKEELSSIHFPLKLTPKLKFSNLNKSFQFRPKKERCTRNNWKSKLKRLKLITLRESETKKWAWNLTKKECSIKLKMTCSSSSNRSINKKRPTNLLMLRPKPKSLLLTTR